MLKLNHAIGWQIQGMKASSQDNAHGFFFFNFKDSSSTE